MTKHLIILTLFIGVHLCQATEVAAAFVLGPEAEVPVMRWLDGLNLKLDNVRIKGGEVVVTATDCTLTLGHADHSECSGKVTAGTTAVCMQGRRCPSTNTIKRRPLTLPYRSAERSPEAAESAARAQLRRAKVEAQRRFDIQQPGAARDALLPLLRLTDVPPMAMVDALVMLTGLGSSKDVFAYLNAPNSAVPIGALGYAITVAATMGPALGSEVLLQTLRPSEACAATAFASGLEVIHGHQSAVKLTRYIRTVAPNCFDAFALEAEMLSTLRHHEAANEVIELAQARFKDHPGRIRLNELALAAAKDDDGLIALYEARLTKGDRSPGLFSILFSLYVKHGVRQDRVAHYLERAKTDPDDDVAALVAGVLLHYEKRFAESNRLVERAAPTFPTEPRVYIYQAMNWFNLGELEAAKRFIGQAEQLAAPDPDVYYCIGEIYRDSDRAKALEALGVYWHMTAVSGGDISFKQKRVWGMITAIKRCVAESTPAPCPGPFEHTFNSVAQRANR